MARLTVSMSKSQYDFMMRYIELMEDTLMRLGYVYDSKLNLFVLKEDL